MIHTFQPSQELAERLQEDNQAIKERRRFKQ
jgi:hypothetical protein